LRAGKTYYAAFSCDVGSTAVVVMANYINGNLPSIFGSTAGAVEIDFKAASHPLPTTLTVTGGLSAAVQLAVRES
jgi:hypothetical protein